MPTEESFFPSDYTASWLAITLGDMNRVPPASIFPPRQAINLAALLVAAWLGAMALVFCVLILRRLSGGLTTPLDFTPAFLVGCAMAIHSHLVRNIIRGEKLDGLTPRQTDMKISLATYLLLLTLTIPSTISLAVMVLWLPWITFELQWWCVRMEPAKTFATVHPLVHAGTQPQAQSTQIVEKLMAGEETEEEDLMALIRRVRTEHSELISGVVQIDFEPRQQIAVAHVAFCPPLPSDPEIMAEPCEGEPVTVRVTESRSYGARLEVKRTQSLPTAERIMIAFEAVAEKCEQ